MARSDGRESVCEGTTGEPHDDCYRPEEGLSASESEQFHAWQIDRLERGGVDFLIAETLPAVDEAVGIARAMGRTALPFLCAAQQPRELFSRLIGYQANASSLDHCDLEQADELKAEDVSAWGDAMLDLNRSYGLTILGGCCGTGRAHLQYIVNPSTSTP